jgi:hypothetical protein
MESAILKTEALCWLRFGKKMPYICTEGGYWNSDVLGVCDKFSVEIEVKVSIADLKREFVTKTAKHYLFANASDAVGPSKGTPNYFYFYVPPEIKDAALEIVKEKAPKAGLAVYGDGWGRPGDKTTVAHRPTKLHEAAPSAQFIKTVLNRMGSELCGRYVVQQRFLDDMLATMKAVDKGIVDVMKQMFQTPDFDQE